MNRPGAKAFEYSGGGPQFGQYRPPPEKLMKDVKDKYKFRTYGEKRQMDDDAASKLDSVFGASSSGSSSGSAAVEVVGADAGPKTAEQKALEKVPLPCACVCVRVRVRVTHDNMFVLHYLCYVRQWSMHTHTARTYIRACARAHTHTHTRIHTHKSEGAAV